MLNAAFIFLAPEADPSIHRSTVDTPEIKLTTIGVSTLAEAAEAAKEMVGKGCTAIELCSGFGIRGTYMVEEAVHGRARVGSVLYNDLYMTPHCIDKRTIKTLL